MNTIRMNITLPERVALLLRSKKNRSSYIAQAVLDKIEYEKRTKLISLLKEGYSRASEEDQKLQEDWLHSLEDGLD